MVVLGIHDGHNSGAALLKDGRILAAISEERLINIKNFSGPPVLSIKEVYRITKIKPEETDLISIGCFVRLGSPYADKNRLAQFQVKIAPLLHSHYFARTYVKLLHNFREINSLKLLFSHIGLAGKPIIFIDHHLTHAACAYYQRPFKGSAVILTLDGSGDGLSATVSVGEGNKIKRIAETVFYDSLSNNLYSEITGYLGMKKWEHEYKVMGLAPYGRDDGLLEILKGVIRINPTKPLEFQNTFGAYLYKVTQKLSKVLVGRRFDNIAWATQKYYEELVCNWVKNAISHTGIQNVVAAGGSFLNVKANKKIREMKEINNFFVYPAADDGGTPVGAALEGYVRLCSEKKVLAKVHSIKDIYYGAEHTDDEIEEFISNSTWKKKSVYLTKNIEKNIAEFLSKGKIVGRFSGRDEWGPRALGNRSILADPRNLSVIHKLNFAIKERDFWMPFASSILNIHADRYLIESRFSPYMIEAFDTRKIGSDIAAAIHPFDRTCRPQTVNDWNPGYEKIIKSFYKLTGVPAILNTSFNLHGFPIVGSVPVALKTFEKSGLDVLAIGNWLIEK